MSSLTDQESKLKASVASLQDLVSNLQGQQSLLLAENTENVNLPKTRSVVEMWSVIFLSCVLAVLVVAALAVSWKQHRKKQKTLDDTFTTCRMCRSQIVNTRKRLLVL